MMMRRRKCLFLTFLVVLCVLLPNTVLATQTIEDELEEGQELTIWPVVGMPGISARVTYLDTISSSVDVLAYEVQEDYSPQNLNELQQLGLGYGATWLSTATAYYNCHSYAWYSQDTATNRYWIDDPKGFYLAGAYGQVSTPQEGDIICYYDNKGTADPFDDVNLHSGIVVAVSEGVSNNLCGDSDLVTVVSKWGAGALYEHNGYRCPYTSFASASSGQADYVKYYRKHVFAYMPKDNDEHVARCTECGYMCSLAHAKDTFSIIQQNYSVHTATCGQCFQSRQKAHTWHSFSTGYRCTKCRMISNIIPIEPSEIPLALLAKMQTTDALSIDENTFLCYYDGQYYLVKSSSAEQAMLAVCNQSDQVR
ncbi:MAG: CHAP domain-containing protein [Clostridia bacterium]|nr:CHAP domain-containing protein [Clostridia bacterium]